MVGKLEDYCLAVAAAHKLPEEEPESFSYVPWCLREVVWDLIHQIDFSGIEALQIFLAANKCIAGLVWLCNKNTRDILDERAYIEAVSLKDNPAEMITYLKWLIARGKPLKSCMGSVMAAAMRYAPLKLWNGCIWKGHGTVTCRLLGQ